MKSSTREHVESKVHKIKGEIKETAGQLLNNPKLERLNIVVQTIQACCTGKVIEGG